MYGIVAEWGFRAANKRVRPALPDRECLKNNLFSALVCYPREEKDHAIVTSDYNWSRDHWSITTILQSRVLNYLPPVWKETDAYLH